MADLFFRSDAQNVLEDSFALKEDCHLSQRLNYDDIPIKYSITTRSLRVRYCRVHVCRDLNVDRLLSRGSSISCQSGEKVTYISAHHLVVFSA